MQFAKKHIFCFCFSVFFSASSFASIFAANDIANHWAFSTINAWISQNNISGYPDGSFRPDNPITRAEFVSLINKAFQLNTSCEISFQDVSKQHWAYNAIQTGVSAGYTQGDAQNTFRPDALLTRAEAASMITRLTGLSSTNISSLNYTDNNQIPFWAKSSIDAVSQVGIMKGFPDGSFRPNQNMTRAEAITALSTALQKNKTSFTKTQQEPQITILEQNTLQNQIIQGDMIIPASMASEEIIFDHVTINGTLFVEGGTTIHIKNSVIDSVELKHPNVILNTDTATTITTTHISAPAQLIGQHYQNVIISTPSTSPIHIDADIQTLEIEAPVYVKLLANADIAMLYASEKAEGTSLSFTENAVVEECHIYSKIKIFGKAGVIDTMNIHTNGIETDIKPKNLLFRDNTNKITYTTAEPTKTPIQKSTQRLTLNTDGEGFNGTGKSYKTATITAQNATLSNTTIEEDVIIQQSIKNTGATLKDLTVYGNVNIYGGRNPIVLKNCTIQKDIISHRNDRTPVTLQFDTDTTVNGNIVIRGNTILTGEKNTILENVLVEQYSGRNLEIDTNINEIEFATTAVFVKLNENKKINTLRLSSAPNTLKIHMENGAVIDTLYADANVEITGNGTIHNIITNKDVQLSPTITVDNITDGFVAVSSIESLPTTMYAGKSISLTGIIKPFNATKNNIHWSIEDAGTTGAILDGNVLTAPHTGTIHLIAEVKNGLTNTKHFRQNFAIEVKDELENFIEVEDIIMTSPTTWDINKPLVLSAAVEPSNATHQLIHWSIQYDEDTKATLTNNTLTAPLAGNITLVASVENGLDGTNAFSKEFKITIIPIEDKFVKVEDITLNIPNECSAGDILELSGTVIPSNANAKKIQWRVEDSGKTGAYIQNHTKLYTKQSGTILLSATIAGGEHGGSKSFYKEFYITVK